jgi:hypothetical protein
MTSVGDIVQEAWTFLLNEKNRTIVSWIGGGLLTAIIAAVKAVGFRRAAGRNISISNSTLIFNSAPSAKPTPRGCTKVASCRKANHTTKQRVKPESAQIEPYRRADDQRLENWNTPYSIWNLQMAMRARRRNTFGAFPWLKAQETASLKPAP